MSTTAIALALFAVLHASWNAFLRNGADRLWTITVMSFSGTLLAVVCAPFLPLPAPAAWPWIVLSAVLQTGYSLFLVAAYRHGELGQVYPIVRGTVPLLVTLGGFLATGTILGSTQIVGVALVAIGIMSLVLGKNRVSTQSLLLAFTTGAIVAAYGIVDSIGVRAAGNVASYVAWLQIIFGTLLPIAFLILRGKLAFDIRSSETRNALAGGLVALAAYGAVVAAFALAPAGPVTALRETSVVFAVLIGWLFLGETLTARRLTACLVVAAGAICLGR